MVAVIPATHPSLTEEEIRLCHQAHLTHEKDRQLLPRWLKHGMSVLDVGCGPGFLVPLLAGLAYPGQVYGLDIDAVAISKAEQVARYRLDDPLRNGRAHYPIFLVGDAHDIRMESNSVDFIFCRFVLEHLKDPPTAVREMVRVVKPGGIVVVIDTDDRGWALTPDCAAFTMLLTAFEQLQKLRGGNRLVGDEIECLLGAVGLENIDARWHVFDLNADEISKVILPIFRLERDEIIRRGLLGQEKFDRTLSAVEAHLQDHSPLLRLPLVYGSGRKPSGMRAAQGHSGASRYHDSSTSDVRKPVKTKVPGRDAVGLATSSRTSAGSTSLTELG